MILEEKTLLYCLVIQHSFQNNTTNSFRSCALVVYVLSGLAVSPVNKVEFSQHTPVTVWGKECVVGPQHGGTNRL